MKNAHIFAQTHIHTNISGRGHMKTCSVNIIYVQLMYISENGMEMLTRVFHMRLVSGNFPCSQKPCTDGNTCVELAEDKSRCVPTSRYKDDVCMFVCTYVTWPYRYRNVVPVFV